MRVPSLVDGLLFRKTSIPDNSTYVDATPQVPLKSSILQHRLRYQVPNDNDRYMEPLSKRSPQNPHPDDSRIGTSDQSPNPKLTGRKFSVHSSDIDTVPPLIDTVSQSVGEAARTLKGTVKRTGTAALGVINDVQRVV